MLYILQYSVPVIKYDRNGFKPRPRQLILTQTAAYTVEEAKIKQRVVYASLKGQTEMNVNVVVIKMSLGWLSLCFLLVAEISVSNLTDGIIVFHITRDDPKQKVGNHWIQTSAHKLHSFV